MRIAFVITGLGMGGAEKIVTSLADSLTEKGHSILIVYLTGDALTLPSHPSVQVRKLGLNGMRTVVPAYFRLRRMLQRFNPDVVHSHLVHANILTRLLRLSVSIPRLISSAHNTNDGGDLRMLAYRLTDGLADISTNVSREAVDAFLNQKAVRPGRMITVHNGISTREFAFDPLGRVQIRQGLGITPETRLIVAVGRMNEQKDYPNLLQALTKIDPTVPHAVCIAGDGPLRQDIEDLSHGLGLDDRVRFLGIRRDIPGLMSAADVFVLPSAWEGFGLVVAEAMACQRVVVATDCGGVREVVGDAGFLVAPRQPDALASALREAMSLAPDESIRLGLAARQRVEQHYSLDAAVDKWIALYTGAGPIAVRCTPAC